MTATFAENSTEQTIKNFLDAVYQLDGEKILDLLTDDAEWWLAGSLPVSGRYPGKDSIANEFLAGFGPIYQPGTLSYEVNHIIRDGDQAVIEWTGRGVTNAGDTYANPYCYVFTVRDDKIARLRGYTDTGYALGMLWGQLRATPTF